MALLARTKTSSSKVGGGTSTRLSEEEKHKLVSSGLVIFISPRIKRYTSPIFTVLRAFIAGKAGDRATELIQSGLSYFALIYKDEFSRDKARATLTKAHFIYNNTKILLNVADFGGLSANKHTVWSFESSLDDDSPEVVLRTLAEFVQASGQICPSTHIARHMSGSLWINH